VIKLVCVGKLKERHYSEACCEYLRRLRKYVKVEVVELREQSDRNPEVAKKKEAALILKELEGLSGWFTIALDSSGLQQTSEEFAETLRKPKTAFIIGGPDGLADQILEKTQMTLSLSDMTLPHQLARVVLLEQIYRGHTIQKKERYHK